MSVKLWTIEVNDRAWESHTTERSGIRRWKALACNALFENCRVTLRAPNGVTLKEKFPKQSKD